MLEKVKKITILGGPGTGKSTLAKNLGKKLNLPVHHLDAIEHFDNWKKRDKKERDEIILDLANKPEWIIDGTYKGTLETRVKKSDLIIFLNYSTIARLKGVISRYLKLKGKEREEIPGCKERITWTFLKFAINWDKKSGTAVKSILEVNKDKRILIFKNRKKLNRWYEEEFNSKIELS